MTSLIITLSSQLKKHWSSSALKLSLIVYFAILIFQFIGVWQYQLLQEQGINARPIGWDFWILWLAGLVALFVQQSAGLPKFIDNNADYIQKYILPFLVGILFALPDVMIIAIFRDQLNYDQLPPFAQPFPYSIFLYYSGAVWVYTVFMLLPVTLVMLVAKRFFKSRTCEIIFWVLAVMISLYEPLDQMGTGNWAIIAYSVITGIAFNLISFYYYKREGWIAALLVRIGHYTIWHVLLGAFIEFIVL